MKYKLEDVIQVYDSKRIPLSSMQRQKKHGKYRYYGAQGVIDYVDDYIFDGEYILVAEDGENLRSRNLPIAQIVEGKFWVNNHAHVIKNNEKSNLIYLCYLLNNIDISSYITGSAQPKLNQENLKNIIIDLPPLELQNKIANFINVFNSKIDLNIKLNDNFVAV